MKRTKTPKPMGNWTRGVLEVVQQLGNNANFSNIVGTLSSWAHQRWGYSRKYARERAATALRCAHRDKEVGGVHPIYVLTKIGSERLEKNGLQFAQPVSPEKQAAAELRRLHAVNADLLEALRELVEVDRLFCDSVSMGYDTLSKWGQNKSNAIIKARAAISRAEGEAMSDGQLPPCDKDVFEYGQSLGFAEGMTKDQAEKWCKTKSAETGDRYDWHFYAGRIHLMFLSKNVHIKREGASHE